MGVKTRFNSGSMSIIFVLLLLSVAWGAADDEPRITSATIGKHDLMETSDMTVIKDDLTRERKLLIVGQATGGGPRVEKVEVSLDSGQTWKVATGSERWQYEFSPLPDYTYHLTLRVTNSDGVVSNPQVFGTKQLTYLPLILSEFIQERLDDVAKAYMVKDRDKYMRFISRGYQNYPRGWHNLRKAIENDFKSLNNVILRFSVNQVFELEETVMADIHWRLTYAGLPEPKEGYVEIHFDPADHMKILVQKKDLYFGSAPIGHDGRIQISALTPNFRFVVTDLDKVGAKTITIRVRITGTWPFSGNLTLQEAPARSGRFEGTRVGATAPGDRAEATYIDELTSDWRRNVRRNTALTF
jgi:hypothetical protein